MAVGYAAAWLGFGVAAYGIDAAVRAAVAQSGWLVAHGWVVGSVVIAGAGAFQFSALKYRCLERCRTPFGFVNAHWRGRNPRRESFALGLAHGLFCVGCCWALMLVTFVVGMTLVGGGLRSRTLIPKEMKIEHFSTVKDLTDEELESGSRCHT